MAILCRMLASISTIPIDLKGYLLEAECSLFRQSEADPGRLQRHGWGIAYYVAGDDGPRLIKSCRALYEDRERFEEACDEAISHIILAHVRRASNPRHLPEDLLLTEENLQPFALGRYSFAHNGTIVVVEEAQRALGGFASKLKGLNDSEVYFLHILKALEEGESIEEAFSRFLALLEALWEEVKDRGRYAGEGGPHVGLNAIMSDGSKLIAFCCYEEDRGVSLCSKAAPYFEMCYSYQGDKLIVASERPEPKGDWRPLRSHQLLMAQARGKRIDYTLKKVG